MGYGTGGDGLAVAVEAIWISMFCLMYVIPMGLAVVSVVAWIVALIDVLQRDPSDFPNARSGRQDPNDRLVWVLVVVLVGVIGAIVYYFVVMKPYPRKRPVPPADAPSDLPQDAATGGE